MSPGLVDTHVHINEPGRTEWEGFDTATRAGAAGGVTTIVDMPLNSVPATTTVTALHAKVDSAKAQCHVDVGFWGGVVPGNAGELDGLVDAGVRGFKCFLVPSGVEEFPAVDEDDLRKALPILARRRVPLLVHAESPEVIAEFGLRSADLSNPRSAVRNPQLYASYLASRPPEAELEAIRPDGPARRRVSDAGPHRPRLVGRRRGRDRERQGGRSAVTAEPARTI